MLHCPSCQGQLRRVHRTLAEKFWYTAMYECPQCRARRPEPRWYALYRGEYPRCPRCGTFRLTRLASRDKIDSMQKGPLNFLQFLRGAELYHCRYCRVQFYDARKPLAPEAREKAAAQTTAIGAPVATVAPGSDQA